MSRSGTFCCTAILPCAWTGRYKRVPGETTAFHIRRIDGGWWPVVEWAKGDDVGSCRMVDDGDVGVLVDAVNAGKARLGAGPGGAFLLDEYGRVLVPASDLSGAAVVVVGECSGPLRFENAFSPGSVFDLYDDGGLALGDVWDRPYVGIRHNLSAGGELYFWEEGADGSRKRRPRSQDTSLVRALRQLRPYGAVRFLVGVGGVVITKVPRCGSLVMSAEWI